MGGLFRAVAELAALFLKLFAAWEKKQDERDYEAVQEGRQALHDGDAAAVNERLDKLLTKYHRLKAERRPEG